MANGEYYINPGQFRDYRGELERDNTFIFINHELNNGTELFAELGQYNSEYRRLKEPAGDFSTALLNIGSDYYYANQIGLTAQNIASQEAENAIELRIIVVLSPSKLILESIIGDQILVPE